jgi:hypothetical protein
MSALDAYYRAIDGSYRESLSDPVKAVLEPLSIEEIVGTMVHDSELDRLWKEAITAIGSHPLASLIVVAVNDVHRHYSDYLQQFAIGRGYIPDPEFDSLCNALVAALEELRKYSLLLVDLPRTQEWTRSRPPSEWATIFDFSLDTLHRRVDAGEIVADKLTTKSWKVRSTDTPPGYDDRVPRYTKSAGSPH